MTRALKDAAVQQQVFHAEKARQILDQESTPLVVDTDKLKVRVSFEQFFDFILQKCFSLIEALKVLTHGERIC